MDFSKQNFITVIYFIERIRAASGFDYFKFNEVLQKIIIEKKENAEFKKQLSSYVFLLLDHAFFVNAFADYGIHSNIGFFSETIKRIKHKVLPPNLPENELSYFIQFLFSKGTDYTWLEKINSSNWEALLDLIIINEPNIHSEKIAQQTYNAIIILTHRLTTIGIDPYLISKMPELDDSNSPFFELNHQVSVFVKKHMEDKTLKVNDKELQAVLKTIVRCELLFSDIQAKKDIIGTSLNLTFLLKRAQQHIDRIYLLLNLFISKRYNNNILVTSQLITELVKAEHTKNSIGAFIRENTNLLAYRIVSHTSDKGESYIGFSKKENQKLFKSAMGGGLIVVFLVYIKYLIHELHLSLFFEGFLFGLNYGLGFVWMHLAHFTLATKQPAMTASYIARSIENVKDEEANPWDVFKQIIRSQFVSLVGNLIIVLPLCFLSAWLLDYCFNISIFNYTVSNDQLYSIHPFYSASLLYACVTGFLLSLSGIIIGYIDNKIIFSEIPVRIMKHPQLIKIYNLGKREKIAAFAEKNLGAILGNLFLGFSLGMAGNIGKFIGIPIDIRHITISAGNFGIALGSDHVYKLDFVLTVFMGILLIGVINIASSFLISFIVACRSRNLSWRQSLKILIGLSK